MAHLKKIKPPIKWKKTNLADHILPPFEFKRPSTKAEIAKQIIGGMSDKDLVELLEKDGFEFDLFIEYIEDIKL